METETLTTQVVTGNGEGTPSQESQAPAQAVPETQPTTDTKVERVDNQPQVQEAQRVKPSNYYRERERVRRLEESIQSQSQRMEEMANLLREMRSPKPDAPIQKLTAEELLNDPDKVFQTREQRLLAEIQTLKQEFNQMKNQGVQSERVKSEREALEMLFPKSSPEADESLEERMQNQERADAINRFLKANPTLDRLSVIDPKGAAELILEKMSKAKPLTSPNAIPKTLMGAVQRGSPGAGRKMSAEDAMADYKKMAKEMELKPELRFNKEHKSKRDQLLADAERLAKEPGNNK